MMLFRPNVRAFPFVQTLTTVNLPASADLRATLEKVRVLATRGLLDEALSLFYTVEPPHSPHTYAHLFHECARHYNLHLGQALHHHMITHKTTTPPDVYTTNNVINMYAKCGDLSTARHLFDGMPQRNIVSWTSLISGYSQHGKTDDCFCVFSDMLAHCRPNDFAYTSVLSVCEGFRGALVHAHVLKTGYDACVYVGNALLAMYWKNGERDYTSNRDETGEAWRVFNSMEFRNLVTWNSMIAGFQMQGLCHKSMYFFALMCRDGVGYDRATLLSVISSFCENDESDYCAKLECCLQLHSVVVKTSFIFDVAVVTALLKAYSSLGGDIHDCYKLFLETNGCRDVFLWTQIIASFAERDSLKALSLFNQLNSECLRPDSYAFSIVLKACGGFVSDSQALAVHCQVVKAGFTDVTVIQNALIHAFSRCGSIVQALQVFDEMETRDVVSWNSILKAYALHGQAEEALDFFKQMDVEPDASTFVALLSACSHAGMVKEGTEIFEAMLEIYGVIPQIDHYACVVDILGRAGHLLEAEKIIKKMPIEPDYVVWSALLGACRKHGKAELADFSVAKLKELDPEKSLGYVLMSNIFCSTASYNEADLIRKKMKGLGIMKEPGLSWTEIRNQIHEFASGGRGHPQGEAIRANTIEIVGQLKKLGYVPEISLSLHDVEEEHKEEQLYYHSEKLALVFALMNDNHFHGGGRAIRIMKNIRICLDCHNFMKLASEKIQREIVVRDSNRFHNFRKGICSCNDYW